jgi:hypothetical protein
VVGALAALLACGACGSFGSDSSDGASDAAPAADSAALIEGGALAEVGPPDEAGDAGGDAPFVPVGPCGTNLDCERIVFVTSATPAGDAVGGSVGADALCAKLAIAAEPANAVLKGRMFVAWLSTSAVAAKARLLHGTKAYRLVDGTVVANNWDDLVDGTIAAPISRTESGTLLTAGSVWTGTSIGGDYSSSSCTDWSATNVQGTQGSATDTNAHWTTRGGGACAEPAHLYCFER